MKLSVIIPAFNEAKHIGACTQSVFAALQANASPDLNTEVIVVDNNSSDATAELARQAGARVVFEPVNQISRARNAGARVAEGDWFLFIDADSLLHAATLRDVLAVMAGARSSGGGCVIGFDRAPAAARSVLQLWNLVSRCCRWAAGSFLYCRAEAFREIGGFTEELFAAEEIDFSQKLKRWSKSKGLAVVILKKQPHISSGRKFYLYSRKELLRHAWRSVISMRATLRNRARLDYFYDGRR